MSSPSKPSFPRLLFLLLGASAGAAGFLYFKSQYAKAARKVKQAFPTAHSTLPQPQPGDILLFYNGRGVDKLITGFTASPFYHAALYAGDNTVVEANTPGVLRRELRGRKEPFVVVPAPKGKGKLALTWAKTQIGDAYDDLDIAVIILDRLCRLLHFHYTPQGKFTCGEFIAVAFDKAGVRLFPEQELSEIVPGDFARLMPSAERSGVPFEHITE